MLNTDFLQLTFLTINPASGSPSYIFVQEVGCGAAACPKGIYCLHASSTNKDDDDILDRIIVRDDSKKVWSLKFKVRNTSSPHSILQKQASTNLISLQIPLDRVKTSASNVNVSGSNFYFCSGPRFELDYDASISHCKAIYQSMFPGEEFLPRAPEPEEIVIGGDDEEATGGVEEEKAEDQNRDERQETGKSVSRNSEPGVEDSDKA